MVTQRLSIVIVVLLFNIPFYGQSKIEIDHKMSVFLNSLEKSSEFSGAILIAKDDSILHNRAYGFANKTFEVPNNSNTKFGIASITKMFTSVAILQLYQKGEIDLNKPIGTYIEDYPNPMIRDSVTVHQLLSHTGGIADSDDIEQNCSRHNYRKLNDFLPSFVDKKLLFSPGSEYRYSNNGFIILGLIVEAVSGISYYEYVKEYIFEPSGMLETDAYNIDEIVPNRATGYVIYGKIISPMTTNLFHISKGSSASGFYSTTKDLFKFSRALLNYKLLNRTTTDLMLKPKVKGYSTMLGYGIDIDQKNGHEIIGHLGGWYGIQGQILMYKDLGYKVIVLSNVDDNGFNITASFFDNLLIGTTKEIKSYDFTSSIIEKARTDGLASAMSSYQMNKKNNTLDENMVNSFAYNSIYHKDMEKGLDLLRLNVYAFPKSLDALTNLAKVCAKLGLKKEAMANYKLALEIEPNNDELKNAIKQLE